MDGVLTFDNQKVVYELAIIHQRLSANSGVGGNNVVWLNFRN